MAETEWNEESLEAPKKKRTFPKWLLFGCGGGCLLAVVAAVAIGIFGARAVQRMKDPEVVWPEVAEIMPFDERPEGWTVGGMGMMGQGQYVLKPPGGEYMLQLFRMPSQRELGQLFDPESRANKGVFGIGGIEDAEETTMVVQGREVRALHCRTWMPDSAEGESFDGTAVRIDLTGDGAIPTFLQVMSLTSVERIEAEDLEQVLAPFDLWRGK